MMRWIFGLTALLLANFLGAQITDSSYIDKHDLDRRDAAAFLTLQNNDIRFAARGDASDVFQNYTAGVGLRFRYRGYGLALAIPVVSLGRNSGTKPSAFSAALQLFPGWWYLRSEGTWLRGFDSDDKFRENDRMLYFRTDAFYMFNGRKMSARAALNLVNRQKRSAGSWVLHPSFSYLRYRSDSLSLNLPDQPGFVLNTYDHLQVGIGGGYGYSFVFKRFAITGIATTWAEFRFADFVGRTDTELDRDQFWRIRGQLSGSITWQPRDTYYGLLARWRPEGPIRNRPSAQNSQWWLRLMVGRRF